MSIRKRIKQIRLETAAANEAARALFRSCGFRVSTVEMTLEIPVPSPGTPGEG